MQRVLFFRICFPLLISAVLALAQESALDQQNLIQAKLQKLQVLGIDPQVVTAVQRFNSNPPLLTRGLDNEKWKSMSILDPVIKSLIKNDLVTYLKTKTDPSVSELFVSGLNGEKVCFYSKPTKWNHQGKPKYEIPIHGKTWIGPTEMDESTGIQQVQVSFPILDQKKPIGAMVVGINLSKLH